MLFQICKNKLEKRNAKNQYLGNKKSYVRSAGDKIIVISDSKHMQKCKKTQYIGILKQSVKLAIVSFIEGGKI